MCMCVCLFMCAWCPKKCLMQSFPALYIEAESLAESGASSSSQHASGTPPGAPAFLLELQLSYHSRPACVWVLGGSEVPSSYSHRKWLHPQAIPIARCTVSRDQALPRLLSTFPPLGLSTVVGGTKRM